ncbi:uncharacterized protein LOC126836209 [Adelges cooleyi]|uniref:uncharacterized protein LOC126836209 n=1 Tax=Adelges cooleyi TaxID=133065 RepID=UPI0021803B57|nr:uncharacterized protein LOC126836209 [Adelges cooleyi]
MKLFCVLLSFICSVYVSADLNLYRREVFITNKHIKAASKNNHDLHGNSLERVIKHIVFANNYGYGYEYNMYALSLMIAVPEHIDLADIFFYIHFQRCIRSVIRLKTSVPVPDVQNQTSGNLNLPQLGKDRRRTTRKALRQIIINVLDGLEYVIETIVNEDIYWKAHLHFMLAFPENANLTNIQIPISEFIDLQRTIREKIIATLPEMPHVDVQTIPVPDEDFENDLRQLGIDRRLLTEKAIKNVIRSAPGLTEPNTALRELCCLIGLMNSTKFGKIFSTNEGVYPEVYCSLYDGAYHYIVYRTFESIWHQVDPHNFDIQLEPLWSQLE